MRRVVFTVSRLAPLSRDPIILGVDDDDPAVTNIRRQELAILQQMGVVRIIQQSVGAAPCIGHAVGPDDRAFFVIDDMDIEVIFLAHRQLSAIVREIDVFVTPVDLQAR